MIIIKKQSNPQQKMRIFSFSTAYPAGGSDASSNTNKSRGSATLPAQQPNHHPQPPVPINGGGENIPSFGVNGNIPSINTGLKNLPPLKQPEEYPPMSANMQSQLPIADASGMASRKNEKIFKHTGGLMDEYGSHPQANAH